MFGCRWLCAKQQRQRGTIEIMGIELSHAFVVISRDKLPDTLETFLDDSRAAKSPGLSGDLPEI